MFFDSVYPKRPSDTVAKYTVYLPILSYSNVFGSYFATLSYGWQNLAQKYIAFYFLR